MISRRQWVSSGDLESVVVRGRTASDQTFEEDLADSFQPVGMVSRPPIEGTVESLTAFVGGNATHPVQVATLDHGRQAVIDVEGLGADETIIYTSSVVIKLSNGKIEIGTVGGTKETLATLADVEAVRDTFLTHIHTNAGGPTGSPQDSGQSPILSIPLSGTQVLKAE